MKKVFDFVVKYVWQFPQMLISWIWMLIRYKSISGYTKYPDYTVYRGTNKGGVTLGTNIFLSNNYSSQYLSLIIAHESGHVKQSKYLGPFYLLVIGIPSILWASTHKWLAPEDNYYSFYTEAWANKLGGVTIGKNGKLVWIEDQK